MDVPAAIGVTVAIPPAVAITASPATLNPESSQKWFPFISG